MKQYVVDELRPGDYSEMESYLGEKLGASEMPGLYKLPLSSEHLTDTQAAHAHCQPYYFAIDLEPGRMACELLVRTDNGLRCDCMGYATEAQRNWLIRFTDTMLHALAIAI